jgi:N-acetylglucosamine-6-sulfatase
MYLKMLKNNFIKNKLLLVLAVAIIMTSCRSVKPSKTEYSAISDNFKLSQIAITNPIININTTSKKIPQKIKKPNVIIVLSDDLDAIYTSQYFRDVLPIVDSLKSIGIDFTNSFTPMSTCCPSRSATLTGSYAHTNGVYRNASVNGGWSAFKHNEPYTLPAYLNKSGYRTAIIGKYLNGYGIDEIAKPVYGWTDGFVFNNSSYYKGYDYSVLNWKGGNPENDTIWNVATQQTKKYGFNQNDYSTDVLTNEAISFLQKTEEDDGKPFFLFLTPTAPHNPLQAAPRYAKTAEERWAKVTIPIKPNFNNDYGKLATAEEKKIPLDKSSFLTDTWKKRTKQMNKGAFFYNLIFKGKVPKSIKSFLQADWYSRLGSLYALNDMIGNLIKTLKENGEWDNTLLVFTSDNGYMLGAHAMMNKATPYEEAIRVPLIITGGDSLYLNTSVKTEEWVTNLDLMPTILDFAGVKIPVSVEGISLVPLLYNDSITNFKDRFVMEYLGPSLSKFGLYRKPKLSIKLLPLYIMDHPSYNAIRMKVTTIENVIQSENVYKYIEWQKNTTKKVLDFSNKYRLKDAELMKKISNGDKKTVALKLKAEEVETELYNITDDPYEMDNLLYYKPEKYKTLSLQLKSVMRDIILKK